MKKYKVGYVQGVFDMFHIGHLNILRNAKSICDYLIVGVNSDRLTKEYKNKIPIIPEKERVEIVSEIKCVDKAVIVDNRDKIEALEKFNYNALIMGSDWKGTEFYNNIEKILKEKNVDIVYFDYTKDISSTYLRKKIDETGNENTSH